MLSSLALCNQKLTTLHIACAQALHLIHAAMHYLHPFHSVAPLPTNRNLAGIKPDTSSLHSFSCLRWGGGSRKGGGGEGIAGQMPICSQHNAGRDSCCSCKSRRNLAANLGHNHIRWCQQKGPTLTSDSARAESECSAWAAAAVSSVCRSNPSNNTFLQARLLFLACSLFSFMSGFASSCMS